MTRKDFQLIADTVKGMTRLCEDHRRIVAVELAASLRTTNQAFNRDKFIRACGVND